MAFIGNTNTTQAFTPAVDYFSGNASTTAFTLSRPVASVAQVQAVVNNVAQNPSSAFTVSGNTITFTSAPSSGTNNIYVYYTSPITQVIAPSQGTVGPVQLDYATLNGTGALTMPSGTTAQRPSSPTVGMMRYNTTVSKYEVYAPTGWQFLLSGYNIEYLVVAGAGGGGRSENSASGDGGGGGGAGGFRTGASLPITVGTIYAVTVGAGGAGSTSAAAKGTNGSDSVFSFITSTGGGGGGSDNATTAINNGADGGSGGGAASLFQTATTGGSGNTPSTSPSQGFAGGSLVAPISPAEGRAGAGGGGSSQAGNTKNGNIGGAGGNGTASSISGSSVTYAGGGGGGTGGSTAPLAGGAGGTGGGGAGGGVNTNGTAGTTNLGGGGGGGGQSSGTGGNGGSGVVILSIPTANYSGTTTGSPTVTTSGSNTILTFTGSGSYTA